LLDLEKHLKKKAERRKGIGEHSQGQSLFIFTLGYSQGGTPSERLF
jgi:hypothetical protein